MESLLEVIFETPLIRLFAQIGHWFIYLFFKLIRFNRGIIWIDSVAQNEGDYTSRRVLVVVFGWGLLIGLIYGLFAIWNLCV